MSSSRNYNTGNNDPPYYYNASTYDRVSNNNHNNSSNNINNGRNYTRSNSRSRMSDTNAAVVAVDEDAAYAQALQEQYRQEFLQRQARRRQDSLTRNTPTLLTQSQSQTQTRPTPSTHRNTVYPTPSAPPATDDVELVWNTTPTGTTTKNHQDWFTVEPAAAAAATAAARLPDDEALASQLQEELNLYQRRQNQQKQQQQHQQSKNNVFTAMYSPVSNTSNSNNNKTTTTTTATSRSPAPTTPTSRFSQRMMVQGQVVQPPQPPLEVDEDEDWKLALELQQQEEELLLLARARQRQEAEEAQQRRNRELLAAQESLRLRPPGRDSNSNRRLSTQQSDFNDERMSFDDDVDVDELQARRIQQELQDAEMAQALSVYEREALSRSQIRQLQQQEQQRATCKTIVFGRLLPLGCVAAALVLGILFGVGVLNAQDMPFIGDIFPTGNDILGNDPWKGDTLQPNGTGPIADSSRFRWPLDEGVVGGLSMEIINTMDDSWYTTLQTAVKNWDNGFPIDSLTLTISQHPELADFECSAINGKIKTCNANYGDTKWRGLNEVLLNKRSNTIISSAAKMNMYYLQQESNDQKLYTICHELGHGFGLPHWDENFFNKDMGTCMDYTNNPSANKQPDASNFLFLAELYGGENMTSHQIIPPNSLQLSLSGDNSSNWMTPTTTTTTTSTSSHPQPTDDDSVRQETTTARDETNMGAGGHGNGGPGGPAGHHGGGGGPGGRRDRRLGAVTTSTTTTTTMMIPTTLHQSRVLSYLESTGTTYFEDLNEEEDEAQNNNDVSFVLHGRRQQSQQQPKPKRRILVQANDYWETHLIENVDETNDDVVSLQYFLL